MSKPNENKIALTSQERRNTISFLLLSFYCGLGNISDLSITYYLKDNLKIEPSEMTLILTLNRIPWSFNIFFSSLIDFFPFFGFSKKFYILLCGFINSTVWLILSFIKKDNLNLTILCIFLSSFTNSFCSVLGHSIILELISDKKKLKSQTLHSYNIIVNDFGILISSFLQCFLVQYFKIKTVFFITSFLPIFVIISGLFLIENSSRNDISCISDNENDNITFIQFIFQKKILIPLIIVFIVFISPNFYETFFYFSVDVLNFSPSDFGIIAIGKTITNLFLIYIYNLIPNVEKYTKSIIIFGRFLYLFFSEIFYFVYRRINLQYGINDFYSVLIISSFQYAIGQCLKIPVLHIGTLLSNKHFGKRIFTIFVFVMNLGFTVSSFFSSGLTIYFGIKRNDYWYLGSMIDYCLFYGIIFLIPLIFIPSNYLNPSKKNKKNKENENEEELIDVVCDN